MSLLTETSAEISDHATETGRKLNLAAYYVKASRYMLQQISHK